VGANVVPLAGQAVKEKRTHVGYLDQAPQIPAAKIPKLVAGGYVERTESMVLMEECGTGKT
jgi:hypothetical protein